MKNGFVLGCEETREGVIIDRETKSTSWWDRPRRRLDHLHPADARARRSHHGRGRREGDRRAGRPASRRSRASTTPCSRADVRFRVGAAAGRFLLRRSVRQRDRTASAARVRVHHARHAPGGVCLLVGRATAPTHGKLLIVGDTLFAGSIYLDSGGDLVVLLDAIRGVLFPFGMTRSSGPATAPRPPSYERAESVPDRPLTAPRFLGRRGPAPALSSLRTEFRPGLFAGDAGAEHRAVGPLIVYERAVRAVGSSALRFAASSPSGGNGYARPAPSDEVGLRRAAKPF